MKGLELAVFIAVGVMAVLLGIAMLQLAGLASIGLWP